MRAYARVLAGPARDSRPEIVSLARMEATERNQNRERLGRTGDDPIGKELLHP